MPDRSQPTRLSVVDAVNYHLPSCSGKPWTTFLSPSFSSYLLTGTVFGVTCRLCPSPLCRWSIVRSLSLHHQDEGLSPLSVEGQSLTGYDDDPSTLFIFLFHFLFLFTVISTSLLSPCSLLVGTVRWDRRPRGGATAISPDTAAHAPYLAISSQMIYVCETSHSMLITAKRLVVSRLCL